MSFIFDITKASADNKNYLQVVTTTKHMQVVLMSIPPGQEIGLEIHPQDQFFKIESGTGEVQLGNLLYNVSAGVAIVIPGGTLHNVKNSSADTPLKLFTVYAPPKDKPGAIAVTKPLRD